MSNYPKLQIDLYEYQLNLKNPLYGDLANVKATIDYVPGGRFYAVAGWGGPENVNAQEWYKIAQSYVNASRLEHAFSIIFKLKLHNDTNRWLRAGLGDDKCDLWDEEANVGIDAKAYYSQDTLATNVFDLLTNKANLSDKDWHKAVNKLFHSDGCWLLSYDDTNKICYQIKRPLQPILKSELVNYSQPLNTFIPNVLVDPITKEYVLDYTHHFSLIICNSDPTKSSADIFYHNYKESNKY